MKARRMLAAVTAAMCLMGTLITGCSSGSTGSTASTTESTASGDQIVLRLSHQDSESHANHLGCVKFAELVEEKTDGRYHIDVYPNAQLSSAQGSIQDCQMGTVDMALVNVTNLGTVVDDLNVFNIPYLINNYDEADAVLMGEDRDYWLGKLDSAGLKGLFTFETGFRDFTNNSREIIDAESIKGLRVRVMENNMMIDAWQRLGCDPVAMSFGDMVTALQQGALDAQENPIAGVYQNHLDEVQSYFSPIHYVYSSIWGLMSPATWNSLSAEDQEIFTECAKEAEVYQREVIREQEQNAYSELEKNGMTITTEDEVDYDSFKAVLSGMKDDYADKYGEMIDRIEAQTSALN